MVIKCFWEHNGDDTLLYSTDFPGAYARGKSLEAARSKMTQEICSYLSWCEQECCEKDFEVVIAEKKSSELNICDADSDAIFLTETMPMRQGEYERLKALALKSASDFLRLYNCVPDKDKSCLAERKTFYGQSRGRLRKCTNILKMSTAIILARLGLTPITAAIFFPAADVALNYQSASLII